MKTPPLALLAALAAASLVPSVLLAEIPNTFPYQGRVAVVGINFTGTGQFKFAAYRQATGGTPALVWNNAGATSGSVAEPASSVVLPVLNGLYLAGLGDTALANMAALPALLSPPAGERLFLRVWFNDGTHGFQQLAPDNELRSVPFAREAAYAASVGGLGTLTGLAVQGAGPSNATPVPGATIPITGAGTRILFVPGYSAFRAGSVDGPHWDTALIGVYSAAMGYNTIAPGRFSTALGNSSQAPGESSTAMGNWTSATGNSSTAFGTSTQALGATSTAMGNWTVAAGDLSTALGGGTNARAYCETAVGQFNTAPDPLSATTWNSADRLFVIGNGLSPSTLADALSVYKNAAFTLQGKGPANDAPAADASVPASGAGTRLMFLPGYSALRAGTVSADQWDAAKIGLFSTALGSNTTASGAYSTALGIGTTAGGNNSTALGDTSRTYGNYSTAIGLHAYTYGEASTALGYYTEARGYGSTATGASTQAYGDYSTATGFSTRARSFAETAVGLYNTDYTPVSTTAWDNTDRLFVIGNGPNASQRHDALIVYKNGNATLWGTLTQSSDRNRKTDIVPADTAAVLVKVAALPLATWKFKDETVTHLGPMAQDFFAAFHLGGTDSGIASVDADGVALAAIQELKKQLDAKETRLSRLEAQNAAKDAEIAVLRSAQSATAARLAALEAKVK